MAITFLKYLMIMLSFIMTTVFLSESHGDIATIITQLVCFVIVVLAASQLGKKENK